VILARSEILGELKFLCFHLRICSLGVFVIFYAEQVGTGVVLCKNSQYHLQSAVIWLSVSVSTANEKIPSLEPFCRFI
jgi:hypothetical protein